MTRARTSALLLALAVMIAGTGCATTPRDDGQPRNADPLEPINRVSYRIHEVGDRYVLRPVARGYRAITPRPVRTGIGNFFRNLGMPVVVVNGLLQGKFAQAADDTGHFLVNTTLGIGGLFDVATRAGIERSDEDFGQTLAVWGVPSGPYVFIPFMGPTTFRDGAGRFADTYAHPLRYYGNSSVRYKSIALFAIQTRKELLAFDRQLKQAADPYVLIREAYLQRREYLIHDGQPPDDDMYDMYDIDDLDDLD